MSQPSDEVAQKGARLPWLTISNFAVFAFSFLAAIAIVAVYFLSQADQRAKDRELERYKAGAAQQIAEAHTRSEEARTAAAVARAEAEKAKLETARIRAGLAATQDQLNAANSVTPFSGEQLAALLRGLTGLKFGDAVFIAAAGNDPQAQRRLQQVEAVLVKAQVPRAGSAGLFVPPATQTGDVQINYWADERRPIAQAVAKAFRDAGLSVRLYKQPREPDPGAKDLTLSLIVIGLAARRPPAFRKP